MVLRTDIDLEELLGTQLHFHLGLVKDTKDPEGRGRIRVIAPGVVEDTDWAEPAGVLGGGSPAQGTFWVPRDGSLVAIGFIAGDIDQAFYFPMGWGTTDGVPNSPASVGFRRPVVVGETAEQVFRLRFGRWEFKIDNRGDDLDEAETMGQLSGVSTLTIRDHVGSTDPSELEIPTDGPYSILEEATPDLGIRMEKESNTLYLEGTFDVQISAGAAITIDAPAVTINGRKVLTTSKPI